MKHHCHYCHCCLFQLCNPWSGDSLHESLYLICQCGPSFKWFLFFLWHKGCNQEIQIALQAQSILPCEHNVGSHNHVRCNGEKKGPFTSEQSTGGENMRRCKYFFAGQGMTKDSFSLLWVCLEHLSCKKEGIKNQLWFCLWKIWHCTIHIFSQDSTHLYFGLLNVMNTQNGNWNKPV